MPTSSLHCLVCYSEKWTPRVILLSPKPLVPLTSIASFIKRKDLFCTCKAGQEVSSIAGSWICWCLDSQCATNFKFNIPKNYNYFHFLLESDEKISDNLWYWKLSYVCNIDAKLSRDVNLAPFPWMWHHICSMLTLRSTLVKNTN